MFSTPLICSSSGVTTLFKTVSAFAPVYEVETRTVGGAMSGYCSIGRLNKQITPNMTIIMEITEDKTGRSIKVLNMISSDLVFNLACGWVIF